jgi:two-component system nitrogen regulation sensor histidine kinase NtrY
LLLLVYLVTRNVVKLIFERKRNIFGHRLRTKLVITFFTLSLFPTIMSVHLYQHGILVQHTGGAVSENVA